MSNPYGLSSSASGVGSEQLFQQASHGWGAPASAYQQRMNVKSTGDVVAPGGSGAFDNWYPQGQHTQGHHAPRGHDSSRGASRKLPADEFLDVQNSGKRWPRANKKKKVSDIEQEISGQNLYKTELCCSFESSGTCRYGVKCQFAHGKSELRPVLRHPKYKTEICKTFSATGDCPYGKRCRFIHTPPHPDRRRAVPSPGYYAPAQRQVQAPIAAPYVQDAQHPVMAGAQWSVEWPQDPRSMPHHATPGSAVRGAQAPVPRASSVPAMYDGSMKYSTAPAYSQVPSRGHSTSHPYIAHVDPSYQYPVPHSMGQKVNVADVTAFEPSSAMYPTEAAAAVADAPTTEAARIDNLAQLFSDRFSLTDAQPSTEDGLGGSTAGSSAAAATAETDAAAEDANRLSIFAKFSF